MRKSVPLLISSVYVGFYLIMNAYEFFSIINSKDTLDQFAGYITGYLAAPHFLLVVLGLIFGVLAYIQDNRTFALVSAILYASATVLLLLTILQMILPVVLSFIGYGTMNQSNFRYRKRVRKQLYNEDLDSKTYKETLEYLRKPQSKQKMVKPVEDIVLNKSLIELFKGIQYLVGFIIIASSFGLEASSQTKLIGIMLGMSVFPMVFDLIADYQHKHRMDLIKFELMYFVTVLIIIVVMF